MPSHVQRLIHAVRTRNHERLRKLIQEKGDVSAGSAAARTALHAAAEEGDSQSVQILIDAGANVNARTHNGDSPLHLAASYGGFCHVDDPDLDRRDPCNRGRHQPLSPEMARILTGIIKEKEPELLLDVEPEDMIGEDIKPHIFLVVLDLISKPAQLYRELISRGIDVDRLDPDLAEQLQGNPRFLRVVELLLDHGADIHALAHLGVPVLRGAVELGTAEMVELLLKRGADANQPISSRQTSVSLIDLALERSRIDIVETLLNHGAKYDPNASWQLHAAAANGRLAVLLWLLARGADINRRNDSGETPLLTAATSGHADVITALIVRGADVRVHNNQGDGILHSAAGWHDGLTSLLPLGLPINEPNGKGRTPLHLAAQSASTASIQALLHSGALVNARDNEGDTPLHTIFDSDEFRPDIEFPAFHALVSAGSDRSIMNHEGKTAFDLGRKWNYPEEYLKLLDPVACADPASFIWLGSDLYAGFLPGGMVSFELDGAVWPSAEHYFHAQKTSDPEIREQIRQVADGSDAVYRLRESKVKPPHDWPQRCDGIMRSALFAKFRQRAPLRQQLLATGSATLISDANCDSYWMEKRGSGFNAIGKMLMQIRAQLSAEIEGKQ